MTPGSSYCYVSSILSGLSVIMNHYDRDYLIRRRPGRYPGQYPSRTSQRPSTPIVYTLLTKVWKNIAPFSVNRFQFRERLGSQDWVPLAKIWPTPEGVGSLENVRMSIGRGTYTTHARCELALILKININFKKRINKKLL